jgi:hypothetical protein
MLDDFYDILNNGYLQFCNKTLTNSYKSILTIFKENNITENITDLHKINNCLKNNSYCIDNEDIEKLKNKIFFNGKLSELSEVMYDLPQTYIVSKYEYHVECFITEIKEKDGEIIAVGVEKDSGEELTFRISELSTETLIDILYFEPIKTK